MCVFALQIKKIGQGNRVGGVWPTYLPSGGREGRDKLFHNFPMDEIRKYSKLLENKTDGS